MKLLQVIIAVVTVFLFLVKQNVFARVCPVKTLSVAGCYREPASRRDNRDSCARVSRVSLSLPKHKADPKIYVDNEYIDYPVE